MLASVHLRTHASRRPQSRPRALDRAGAEVAIAAAAASIAAHESAALAVYAFLASVGAARGLEDETQHDIRGWLAPGPQQQQQL